MPTRSSTASSPPSRRASRPRRIRSKVASKLVTAASRRRPRTGRSPSPSRCACSIPNSRTRSTALGEDNLGAAIVGLTKLRESADPYLAADASYYLARAYLLDERFEDALPLLADLQGKWADKTAQRRRSALPPRRGRSRPAAAQGSDGLAEEVPDRSIPMLPSGCGSVRSASSSSSSSSRKARSATCSCAWTSAAASCRWKTPAPRPASSRTRSSTSWPS